MKNNKLQRNEILWGILIGQLIIGPVSPAFAQQGTSSSSAASVQAATSALQMVGQGVGSVLRAQQSAAQMASFQSDLAMNDAQYLSENFNYKTGYPFPDPVFHACRIPLTHMEIPKWCETPPADQTEFYQMQSQMELAQNNKTYYEQFVQMSVNRMTQTGLACMEEKAQALTKNLQMLKNNLERHVEAIKKYEEKFKRDADELYASIVEDNAVVNGGQELSAVKQKEIEDQLKDSNCQVAIDWTDSSSKKSLEGGLKGMSSSISDSAKKSKDLIKRGPQIKKQIEAQIDDVMSAFSEKGFSGLQNYKGLGSFLGGKNIKAVNDIIDSKLETFRSDYQTAAGKISSASDGELSLPSISDTEMYDQLVSELSIASKKLERSYYQKCMKEAFSKSGISYDEIWTSVYQQGVSTQQGSTVLQAQGQIKSEMSNSSLTLDQTISAINELETTMAKSGKVIKVKVNSVDYQLSDLLRIKQNDCKILLSRADPETGLSKAQEIQDATQRIADLKEVVQKFNGSLSSYLNSRVLNCSHQSGFVATQTSCSDQLDIESESFCYENSINKCATSINNCNTKIEGLISERNQQKEAKAKQLNEGFDRLLVQRDLALEQMKKTYSDINSQLKVLVKETKNEQLQNMDLGLGELIIEAPRISLDPKTGEKIVGGGDWESWFNDNSLSTKWPTIEAKITEQESRINTIVSTAKTDLEGKYRENMSAWDALANQCKGLVTQFAQQDGERAAKQGACEQAKLGFCRKAASAFGPGCGDIAESLSSDLDMILGKSGEGSPACASVDSEVWVSNFSAYCSQVYAEEGESDVATDYLSDDDGLDADSFDSFCSGKKDVKMKKAAASTLYSNFKKEFPSIKEDEFYAYVDGSGDANLRGKINSALKDTYGSANEITKFYLWLSGGENTSKKSDNGIASLCSDYNDKIGKGPNAREGVKCSNPTKTEGKDGEPSTTSCPDFKEDVFRSIASDEDHSDALAFIANGPRIMEDMSKRKGASSFNMGEFGLPSDCGSMNTLQGNFDIGELLSEDDNGVGALSIEH